MFIKKGDKVNIDNLVTLVIKQSNRYATLCSCEVSSTPSKEAINDKKCSDQPVISADHNPL